MQIFQKLIQQNIRTQLQMSSSESEEDYQSNDEYVETKEKEKKAIKPKQKGKEKLIINISDCQYPVVTRVSKKFGWKTQKIAEANDWDVCWTDNAVPPEILMRMEHHQKINHFPGMFNLARKNLMGRYLMKMRKKFPEQYSFFPMTWMLPIEYHDLKAYFDSKPKGKARTFIVKPEAMSQGKGIFLTRKIEDIEQGCHCVVQRYLHKPYLIEGLKFDLRIYVLVASVDPLRLYIFNEGLARFATEKYVPPTRENMDDVCMHLTNYAINKDNPKFVFNSDSSDMSKGHKRSLSWFYQYLEQNQPRSKGLQQKIEEMIVKTMISGLPPISNQYRSCQPENFSANMCFELLGFDVMLTEKCEPVLLEINHTPSFSTDTPLDNTIKTNYIRDSLILMNINEKMKNKIVQERREACQQRVLTGKKVKLTLQEKESLKKKCMNERDKYENKNLGGFKKIYPVEDEEKMKEFKDLLAYSDQIFQISTGTKKASSTGPRKAEKSESAFGSCFTRKPKESQPKSSTVKNSNLPTATTTNHLFNRKYESKKMIGTNGELENKFTHSENLINGQGNLNSNYSDEQISSNKNTDKDVEVEVEVQVQVEAEVDRNKEIHCFNTVTPAAYRKNMIGNSTGNLREDEDQLSPLPKMHHAHSEKHSCNVQESHEESSVDPLKQIFIRTPLEENQQFFSDNKKNSESEHNFFGQNIAKKGHKNFKFLNDFQQKNSVSSRIQGNQGLFKSSPLSQPKPQMLKITNQIMPGNPLKNVDILFEEPQLQNPKKSHNVSGNGRSGFEGFKNGIVRLGSEAERQKRVNKSNHGYGSSFESKGTIKYRNVSNRQKIPIMLNTLLINGSEGNTAISAQNLRKILNNK